MIVRSLLLSAALGVAFLFPTSLEAGTVYWPCSGTVTSPYGPRSSPCSGCSTFHHGIDIGVGTGTDLAAPWNGNIAGYGYDSCGGNIMTINLGGGWQSRFLHTSSAVVGVGSGVSRNQHVAESGGTGSCTTGPHLHFEMRKDGVSNSIPGGTGAWVTRNAAIGRDYAGCGYVPPPVVVRRGPSMFYDLGNGGMNIYRWASTGSTFSPITQTGIASGYSLTNVGQHMVSTDANGDGHTDNVVAFQYPDGTFRLHVFLNGSDYQGSTGWFQSGNFNLANVDGRMVGGDFDGNGKGDVAMLYKSGPTSMIAFRFLSNGSSFSYDSSTLASGYDLASVADNVAAADINGDGRADVMAAYQYPDGTFRMHVFLNGNAYQGDAGWFQSGNFNLANVDGRMVGGDFDGNGKGDVAMLYKTGTTGVIAFRFLSNGSSFSYDSATLPSGYSLASVGKNVAAGDANGDGRADVVTAYQYPDGTFRYHVWLNGNWYQGDAGWYQSGAFGLYNVAGRMTMGSW